MSEYNLSINGQLELGDFCDIQDYIDIVDLQDKLNVVLSCVTSEESEIIRVMLKNKKFSILDMYTDESGKINIKACKNL